MKFTSAVLSFESTLMRYYGNLSKLIEKVLKGDEVIIGKAGKPVTKLVMFGFG